MVRCLYRTPVDAEIFWDIFAICPRRQQPEGALFVRLPATAVGKLDRAAEALGMRKKDLVAGLVSKYVDPDSRAGSPRSARWRPTR